MNEDELKQRITMVHFSNSTKVLTSYTSNHNSKICTSLLETFLTVSNHYRIHFQVILAFLRNVEQYVD